MEEKKKVEGEKMEWKRLERYICVCHGEQLVQSSGICRG